MRGLRKYVVMVFILAVILTAVSVPMGPSLAFQVQNTGGGSGDTGSGAAQAAAPAEPATPSATSSQPGTKPPPSRRLEESTARSQGCEGGTSLSLSKEVSGVTAFEPRIILDKHASACRVEMLEGENGHVTFTIGVDAVYSNFFNISGSISITNTGEYPACVTCVKDTVRYRTARSGWLSAVTDITTQVPGLIPVGGPYTYRYSGTFYLPLPLDSVVSMNNKVEVTVGNCSQPEAPSFCCDRDFAKPEHAVTGTVTLADTEKVCPSSGLSCVTDSVTINGAPASLSGPWSLDMSNAPFEVVLAKTLTGEEAGEYVLCNSAEAGGARSQADVCILVRDKPGKKISGHKYEDLDCDGMLDPGEPGVAGWGITLNGLKTVLTDANGYYEFTGLPCGIYLVSEERRSGWHSTVPDCVSVDLMCSDSGAADFLNYHEGSISGHKYEDLDGDGALDPGEPGVAGWEITLTTPCGLSVTTLTDSNGYYGFCSLECGDYLVTEGKRNGWYATAADEVGVHLGSGGGAVADFLNCRKGKISGHKYEDLDGDGALDPGEPGVAGWEIRLNGETSCLTDANGYYEFAGLKCGDYLVSETAREGWRSTGAAEASVRLSSGGSPAVDFLNCRYCSIGGTKWEDFDGDGIADTGEPGLAGVTIQLWSGDALVETEITGSGGEYVFEEIDPGDYLIREVVPSGMYATSPVSISVAPESGDDLRGVDFRNARLGSIAGTKWDDPDADGIHEAGEAGVSGVTITLSRSGAAIASTVTAADGTYAFGELAAGGYSVTETLPPGYANTTPASLSVTVAPGQEVTGVDFLNAAVAGAVVTPAESPSAATGTEALPDTGFDMFPWLLAAGMLVLAGILALILEMVLKHR